MERRADEEGDLRLRAAIDRFMLVSSLPVLATPIARELILVVCCPR